MSKSMVEFRGSCIIQDNCLNRNCFGEQNMKSFFDVFIFQMEGEKFISYKSNEKGKCIFKVSELENKLFDLNIYGKNKKEIYTLIEQINEDVDIENDLRELFQRHDNFITFIKNKTESICLFAIENNFRAFEFMPEECHSEKVCEFAIGDMASNLKFISKQNNKMCLLAVSKNGKSLEFVKKQTAKICLAAVRKDGLSLQYVKKQTPELCMEAIKSDPEALFYVKEQTEEMCMEAVKMAGYVLSGVNNKTPEMCKVAVSKNSLAIRYVPEQTEELCLLALEEDPESIRDIKEPTEQMYLNAVSKNGLILEDINNQTYEICLAAVRNNEQAKYFIRDKKILYSVCDELF